MEDVQIVTSVKRKKLTVEEKKEKAQKDKEKLLEKRKALQEQLTNLNRKEKLLNDTIGAVEEVREEKRSKRTHRLIEFAGKIETIFGKGSASDLLYEVIKDYSADIKKAYETRLAEFEAKEAEKKVTEIEKKLADKNDLVQAKIAEMQKPDADIVTLASDVRKLGNEVKRLSTELEEERKKIPMPMPQTDEFAWCGNDENPFG